MRGGGGGGGGVRSWLGSCRGLGQGGCIQRIEVFVKMQKKSGGGGRGLGVWTGGRVDVYKELIEVFVKMKKKVRGGCPVGGSGVGVRVDVYKKLTEVILKMKNNRGGGRVQRSDQGLGVGRGVARLGVVGDVVYGGCKPRIEGIDKSNRKEMHWNWSNQKQIQLLKPMREISKYYK